MKKLHTTQYKCIIRHFADGDTVYILHECDHCFLWQCSYLRIRGIESWELRSENSDKAKAIAQVLTERYRNCNGELYLSRSGTEKHGRYVGDIMIDGKFLSETLVDQGFAWLHDFSKKAKIQRESNFR